MTATPVQPLCSNCGKAEELYSSPTGKLCSDCVYGEASRTTIDKLETDLVAEKTAYENLKNAYAANVEDLAKLKEELDDMTNSRQKYRDQVEAMTQAPPQIIMQKPTGELRWFIPKGQPQGTLQLAYIVTTPDGNMIQQWVNVPVAHEQIEDVPPSPDQH